VKYLKEHKKVGFVSLGCPKNLVDSEVMLGILARHDYKITSDHQDADVIIINTCGFIESAKKESIDTILELAKLKETGSLRLLVVSGCLPQRYQDELTKELPEVDLWIGTGEYHKIVEYLEKEEKGSHLIQSEYIYDDLTPRLVSTPTHSVHKDSGRVLSLMYILRHPGHPREVQEQAFRFHHQGDGKPCIQRDERGDTHCPRHHILRG